MVLVLSASTLGYAVTMTPPPALPLDEAAAPSGSEGIPLWDAANSTLGRTFYDAIAAAGVQNLEPTLPTRSLLFDLYAPAEAVVMEYAGRAQLLDQPLSDAILLWQHVTGIQEDPALLSFGLQGAAALPQEFQEAAAVLLYAVADATLLQTEAIRSLSDEDIFFLLDYIGRLDPSTAPEGEVPPRVFDEASRFESLSNLVDMDAIVEGARLMAAAVAYTLPTLQDLAQDMEREQEALAVFNEKLAAYHEKYNADAIRRMTATERIDAIMDYMRLAASIAGMPIPDRVDPPPLRMDVRLSDALTGYAELLGVPLQEPGTLWELLAADALPQPLQAAIARLLEAHGGLVQAYFDSEAERVDPTLGSALFVTSALRVVATIQEVYPTLLLYHHLYHLSGPAFPKTLHEQGSVIDHLTAVTRMMGDSRTSLAEIVSLAAYLQGWILPKPEFEPDLTPGSLGRTTLALYDRVGAPYDDELAIQIVAGSAQLDATVEASASRVLQAQLAAWDMLDAVWKDRPAAQYYWVMDGSPRMDAIMASGMASPEDVGFIEEYFSALEAYRQALFEAGVLVAQAIDEARDALRPLVNTDAAPGVSPPMAPSSTSGGPEDPAPEPEGDFGPAPMSMQTSSAAPVACQNIPVVSDCDNFDALFIDPVLRWVMITGDGSTDYNPNRIRPVDLSAACSVGIQNPIPNWVNCQVRFADGRDQLLTLDLGGDDIYRTGQAFASQRTALANLGGFPVAVLIDMGGSDQYVSPPPPFNSANIQAAATAGIAFLVDDAGDDRYETGGAPGGNFDRSLAQGAATIGLAVLLDESGNDAYLSRMPISQGAGGAHDVATSTGGIGILVDRERGEALGNDFYRITHASQFGQGMSNHATGILVDAAGDDEYRGGGQGRVRTPGNAQGVQGRGLAVFADLDGQDTYSRRVPGSTENPTDGMCFTGLHVLVDPEAESPVRVDEGPIAPTVVVDISPIVVQSEFISAFIDLKDGDCNRTIPAEVSGLEVPDLDPEALIEDGPGEIERILADLLSGDSDGDLWFDAIEQLVGTDPDDPQDYPAGLPSALDLGVGPTGSAFIVRIPLVFALGDVGPTTYEGNYLYTVDLGGRDTYLNKVGSSFAELVAGFPRLFPQGVHLDIGNDDDTYMGDVCTQACTGFLFDFGGDDHYVAQHHAQAATPHAIPARLPNGNPWTMITHEGMSILADFGGNDRYEASFDSQAFSATFFNSASTGGGSYGQTKWALFFEFEGDDEYRSRDQAVVVRTPRIHPSAQIASLIDFMGDDTYVVQHQSRIAGNPPSGSIGMAQLFWSHFVDLEGRDTYIDFATGAVWSDVRNQRYEASIPLDGRRNWLTGPQTSVSLRTWMDVDSGSLLREVMASNVDGPGSFHVYLPTLGVGIGNHGNTVYREPFALSIDLSGNDLYLNNAGATVFSHAWAYQGPMSTNTQSPAASVHSEGYFDAPRILAALLVDVAGDDTYDDGAWLTPDSRSLRGAANPPTVVSPEPGSGGGVPPAVTPPQTVGLPPRDHIRSLAQGAGFLGTGMLVDADGHDEYTAYRFAQGAAVLGVGILWDRRGDDVYSYDGALVRSPHASDRVAVWMDRRNGRWDIFMLDRNQLGAGPAQAVALTGPDLVVGGVRGDHVDPVIDGNRIIWSAHFGREWDLFWRDGNNLPVSLLGHFFANRPDFSAGNQVTPRLDGTNLVYIDDRSGVADVALMTDLDRSSPPFPRTIAKEPLAPKRDPDISGRDIVWSQWNATTSRWQVHHYDMVTRVETVLDPVAPLGDRVRPRVHDGFVVWQEWHAPRGDWNIIGYELAQKRRVPIAVGPGDQVDHDANREGVIYIDHAAEPPALQVWFRGQDRSCTVARADQAFSFPAFDSSRFFEFYYVAMPRGGPTQPLHHEVEFQSMAACTQVVRLTDSQTRAPPLFLQGASVQRALGILVDEGGHDRYQGWDFAQGSAFSIGAAPSDPMAGNIPANQGTALVLGPRGVLIDLDGHDVYVARSHAQGSHGAGIFVNVVSVGAAGAIVLGVAILALADHSGVLIDLKGNDYYQATARSQGFSGLAFGGSLVCVSMQCDEGFGSGLDASPSVINSVGLFVDLGGIDEYVYRPVELYFDVLEQLFIDCSDLPGSTTVEQHAPGTCAGPGQVYDDLKNSVRDLVVQTGNSLKDFFDPDPETRNDQMWRQSSFGKDMAVVYGGARTPGVAFHPGGFGIDLGVFDRIGRELQDYLTQAVGVEVQASQGGTPIGESDPVGGTITLTSQLQQNSAAPTGLAVQAESVEYFARHPSTGWRFLGFGNREACGFCLDWSTATADWPDGDYDILGRANLALRTGGTTIGFVDGGRKLLMDNPPRLADVTLSPGSFSPRPYPNFDPDPGDPRTTVVQASVSRHTDNTAGFLRIEVLDATGDVVATLREGAVPNPGLQTWIDVEAAWDGTYDVDGSMVPRGTYFVRLDARDGDARPPVVEILAVDVDGEAPQASCVRSGPIPCNGVGFLGVRDIQLIQTGQGTSASVQVSWSAGANKPASLIREYTIYSCQGFQDACDGKPWASQVVPGGTVTSEFFQLEHAEKLFVLVLTEDRLGNLEYGINPDGEFVDSPEVAFESKRAAGEYLELQVDIVPPKVSLDVLANGETLSSTVPLLVSRTSDARIKVTVREDVALPVTTELLFFNAEQESLVVPFESVQPDPTDPFTVSLVGAPWHDVVPSNWLGGALPYMARSTDAAGNMAEFTGVFFFDPDPPQVLEAHVLYPEGRVSANAGDFVDVVVRARDPCVPLCSPIQELDVRVDVSQVNETLTELPLRFKPPNSHTARLRVDTVPEVATLQRLDVHVVDPAGNSALSHVDLAVGDPVFGISEAEVDATHDRLVIRWTTESPSLGGVEWGKTRNLGSVNASANQDPATDHEVVLEGLSGSTQFWFRVFARDLDGLRENGPLRDAHTASGLEGEILFPTDDGMAFSQAFTVAWEGRMLSDPAAPLTYEVGIRPVGGSTPFILSRMTQQAQGASQTEIRPSEFTDGAYVVVVTVRSDVEEVSFSTPAILLDRRSPQVQPLSPRPGEVFADAGLPIEARILDALSGVDPTTTSVLLNGEALPTDAFSVADGTLRVKTPPYRPGANAVMVTARDHAGNSAARSWEVVFDAEPPVLEAPILALASDQARAKPGDEVTLSVRANDDSAIRKVWADVSGVSAIGELSLDPVALNRYEGVFFVDAFDGPSGASLVNVTILVRAQDEHGYATQTPAIVNLSVDTEPPRILKVETLERSVEASRVRIVASEPVTVELETAGAWASPLVESSKAQEHEFDLVHLGQPGPRLDLVIHATDLAGHVNRTAASVETIVAFDRTPPSPPLALQARPVGNGKVLLEWLPASDDTGILEYRVFRREEGQAFQLLARTGQSHHFDTKPPGPGALYMVVAVDLAGHESVPSDQAAAKPVWIPTLVSARVDPHVGTVDTEFAFRVTFVDPSGDDPEWVRGYIGGLPFTMHRLDAGSCDGGCTYISYHTLPAVDARTGPISYYYEAKGVTGIVRAPSADALRGPLVLQAGALPSPAADEPGALVVGGVTPLPGSVWTLLILCATVFVLDRRRWRDPA